MIVFKNSNHNKYNTFTIKNLMAYNEQLAGRVREALADLNNVEEKKMFRGIAFMVNDKMCINVGDDELMCRIDPALHDFLIEEKGARTMKMKGREYKGYVLVSEQQIKNKEDFDYWINLSLDFNERAKKSVKKKK